MEKSFLSMTKNRIAVKEKLKQTDMNKVAKQITWWGKICTVCHRWRANISNIRTPKNQDHYITEKLSQGINNCITFRKHEKDLLYRKTFLP